MDGNANDQVEAAENVVAMWPRGAEEEVSPAGVARHRRHRFPGRTESVRARYDTDELATVAAAADRARLTTSGYVAAAAARLAVRRDAVNVNQGISRR